MAYLTRIFLTIAAIGSIISPMLPAQAESSSNDQTEPALSSVAPAPVVSETETNLSKSIVVSEELSRETIATKPSAPLNPRTPVYSRIFPAPSMQQ